MFNGSVKSQRKINLGGRNRRNGGNDRPTGRSSVLEAARRRREERQVLQRQNDSCRSIQTTWRGYATRKVVSNELLRQILENKTAGGAEIGVILSAPLLKFAKIKKIQVIKILLEAESKNLGPFASIRMAYASLNLLHHYSTEEKTVENKNEYITQLLRIIKSLTKTFVQPNSTTLTLGLLSTLSHLISVNPKGNVTKSIYQLANQAIRANSEPPSCASKYSEKLKACLAASIFCNLKVRAIENVGNESVLPFLTQIHECSIVPVCLMDLLFRLGSELSSSSNHLTDSTIEPTNSNSQNFLSYNARTNFDISDANVSNLFTNKLHQITANNEHLLLINTYPFLTKQREGNDPNINKHQCNIALIQILHHAMMKNPKMAVYIGIVASGQNVNKSNFVDHIQSKESIEMYDDDEDSDEDEDVEMADVSSTRKKKKYSSGNSSNRSDYITVPRLNKLLFQHNISKQNEVQAREIESFSALTDIANDIGNGNTLLRLGTSVLSSGNDNLFKGMYCSVLSLILSETMYNNTNVVTMSISHPFHSSFLSNLTLRGEMSMIFLNEMWNFVQNAHQPNSQKSSPSPYTNGTVPYVSSAVVFCDLFFYFLIARDDEEFVELYVADSNSIISASRIVKWLRNLLQDLYWVKPALSSHLKDSPEGKENIRLLLSGTKLYNALYERWCRLPKLMRFCEESTWWFLTDNQQQQHQMRIIGKVRLDSVDSSVDIMSDDDDDDDGMDIDVSTRTAEDQSAILASSFSDAKVARLLTAIPQALPFERRVATFNSLLENSKRETQDETLTLNDMLHPFNNNGKSVFTIRRDNIFQDAMKELNKEGRNLRRKVQIQFVNEHGLGEAGVDGGGLFKEFLDDLIKEAFSSDNDEPLFSVTSMETLHVSPGTEHRSDHYGFLGRILGKALYEGILVEPQFCLPFLNSLLGKRNSLDDLKNLDPTYSNHLKKLRKMSDTELCGLGLSFEITSTKGSSALSVELIPNGSNIPVTRDNVLQFIHLISNYKLNVEGSLQSREFVTGFHDLIPAPWLRLFSSYELQKLISGDDSVQGIDVGALRKVIVYAGGYHQSQPIIQWFWEVLEYDCTPQQQRMFLKFMTSCSRQPLLGFGALSPVPCIRQVRLSDEDIKDIKLPTASTCMNLLKLPNYGTKSLLKEKLLYAIESGAGFELS